MTKIFFQLDLNALRLLQVFEIKSFITFETIFVSILLESNFGESDEN